MRMWKIKKNENEKRKKVFALLLLLFVGKQLEEFLNVIKSRGNRKMWLNEEGECIRFLE